VLRAAEFNPQAAGCDVAGEDVTLGDCVTLVELAAEPVQAPESAEAGAPSQKPDKWCADPSRLSHVEFPIATCGELLCFQFF
jgi:hypothetical protein